MSVAGQEPSPAADQTGLQPRRQLNHFYSVLVLQRYDATLVQIEVVLNTLLVSMRR